MSVTRLARKIVLAGAMAVAGCAAPSLSLYTLGGTPVTADPQPPRPPLGHKPMVIEIPRVSVPDELDTEDIFIRDGTMLRRSDRGRWASRLSLGATQRLTGRLAARRPDALVTDRAQAEAPAYRILVNISRLDVTQQGMATLEADWLVVPRDPATVPWRNRARFSVTGPIETDQAVVVLEEKLLDRLAGAIDVTPLR